MYYRMNDNNQKEYIIVTENTEHFVFLNELSKAVQKKYKQEIKQNLIRMVENMHSKNITNNNIQPNNILIHPKTFQVKIFSFLSGICKKDFPKPIEYYAPSYMMPELKENSNKKISFEEAKSNDIYSLMETCDTL